jgi:hypothetical protein
MSTNSEVGTTSPGMLDDLRFRPEGPVWQRFVEPNGS